MKPRLHLMDELFQYQVFGLGNLIGDTEYLDEDLMGKVAPLATIRCRSNSHRAMAWGCMHMYRALLSTWDV